MTRTFLTSDEVDLVPHYDSLEKVERSTSQKKLLSELNILQCSRTLATNSLPNIIQFLLVWIIPSINISVEIFVLYLIKTRFISLYDDNETEVIEIAVAFFDLYLIILPNQYYVNAKTHWKNIGKERVAIVLFFICYYVLRISTGYTLGVIKEMECKGILFGLGVGLYSLLLTSSVTLYTTDMTEQVDIIHDRIESLKADPTDLDELSPQS